MDKDREVTDVIDVLDNVNISYRGSIALYKKISARIRELGYDYCLLRYVRSTNEIVLSLFTHSISHKHLMEFKEYTSAPGKLEFSCGAFLNEFEIRPNPEGCTYTCRLIQDRYGCDFVVIHLWNQIKKIEVNIG